MGYFLVLHNLVFSMLFVIMIITASEQQLKGSLLRSDMRQMQLVEKMIGVYGPRLGLGPDNY